jgi:hypothetical protein
MSTDWEKYSSAEETQARSKNPKDNAVISMISGEVGKVPGLVVEHTPDVQRRVRAHTDVIGDKRAPEVRVKLGRLAQWAIRLC